MARIMVAFTPYMTPADMIYCTHCRIAACAERDSTMATEFHNWLGALGTPIPQSARRAWHERVEAYASLIALGVNGRITMGWGAGDLLPLGIHFFLWVQVFKINW